jgi:hypothetical protein
VTRSLAVRAAEDLQIYELCAVTTPTVESPAPETAPAARLPQPAAPKSGAPDPPRRRRRHGALPRHAKSPVRAPSPHQARLRERFDAWQDEFARTPEPETAHHRGDAERPIEPPNGSIGVTVLKFDISDWMLRRHGQDLYVSAEPSVRPRVPTRALVRCNRTGSDPPPRLDPILTGT